MQFREVQKFNQPWIYFIIYAVAGLFLYFIVKQIVFGIPVGNHPMSNIALVFTFLIPLGLIFLFQSFQLTTLMNAEGIFIEFAPMTKKKLNWSEIKNLEVIQYGFVGYGIRVSSKYNIVYNTSGNKGLLITLKNGRNVLVGTQKEADLKMFISKNEAAFLP